jgi:S1-C subfamily serine protease
VGGANGLRLRVAQTPPGAKIRLTLLRDGKEQQVETTVADQGGRLGGPGAELLEGIAVAGIDEDQRKQFGIPERVHGLVVTAVDAASPFARHLREGTVVIEVNDRPADSLADARAALREGVNKFYVWDRGRVGYVALRVER